MIYRDYLWKAAFREFMQDFVQFFFPHKYDEIDWTKGIEFLDKELQRLYPKSIQKNRIADVLVRLHLKNGKSIWVLLHIEVQGYTDDAFGQRMHQMRYRIEDLFGINPVMLAIFTDDDLNFHPLEYELETWGASCRTRFLTYKVMEVPPSIFPIKDSPVAILMEVVYHATQSKKLTDEAKMDLHLPLVKRFLTQGYSKSQIKTFLSFVEGYIKFDNFKNHRNFGKKIDDMVRYETAEDIFRKVESDLQKRRKWLYKQELKEAHLEIQQLRLKAQEEQEQLRLKIQEEQEQLRLKAQEEREQSILFMLSQSIDRQLISKILHLTLEDIEEIELKYKDKNPLNGYLNGHSEG